MPKKFSLLFGFLLLVGPLSNASWQSNWEILGSSTYHHVTESLINPSNRVLELPLSFASLELRPDTSWEPTERLKFVVRSRLLGDLSYISYQDTDTYRSISKGHADLSDAFLSWNMTDQILAVVGLQNYQWGPAELYSPSNPFFHFNGQQKSFFYKEKGHVLLRINTSFDSGFDLVIMNEPVSNNEKYWIEDREFSAKTLLKAEYQFANRINYFSAVAGSFEQGHNFVGEYAHFAIVEGLSIYGDARHTQGLLNYRPLVNGSGQVDLVDADSNDKSWYTLAVVGIRYEQGSFDLRQEYLYNEAGYSAKEWDSVISAATTLTLNLSTNLRRMARPGLEFMGQHYSYTSLRIPDLGAKKDMNFYLRYLTNLVDQSGVVQMDYDKSWNESVVLYAEAMTFLGRQNSEFRLTDDFQISLGVKKTL